MPLPPCWTSLPASAVLLVLLGTAPHPVDAAAEVAAAQAAVDPTGPLVACLALAAWALALWLLVTVALVMAARAPGVVGRAASALCRRVAPAAVRRAVEVALGMGVALAGATAPASAASAPAVASAAVGTAVAAGAAGTAPGDAVRGTDPVSDVSVPSLDWPTEPPAPSTRSRAAAVGRPATSAAPAPVVVVAPGDTLWALAEAHLERTGTAEATDRQIAAAWPLWWSANREVVGADPDLILPGTVLQPPAA